MTVLKQTFFSKKHPPIPFSCNAPQVRQGVYKSELQLSPEIRPRRINTTTLTSINIAAEIWNNSNFNKIQTTTIFMG